MISAHGWDSLIGAPATVMFLLGCFLVWVTWGRVKQPVD